MPVRLMPPVVDKEQIPLWSVRPADFTVGSVSDSGGMWRYTIENDVYSLDPTGADSYGKPNIVDPSNNYPFDGDLSTRSSSAGVNSTTWIDIDVGVDMSTPNRYLILWKFYGMTRTGSAGYVGLFASEDMVTWTLLWSTNVPVDGANYIVLIKPVRCRAVKAMAYNSVGGSYSTRCQTYELSLYKV